MPDKRALAEGALIVPLLVYLFWLPLPFGSVTDAAQPLLVLPPLLICAAAALLRLRRPAEVLRPLRIWTIGAVLFTSVVAIQLLPLPALVLRILSPESARLWSDAGRIASLAGSAVPSAHPMSVDPATTFVHFFRVVAYAAIFLASALLFRRHRYRLALACVVGGAAVFESLYGVREAVLRRYAIWGWVNTLIFNRVTGTFVNPNHFAHYAAIVMPLGVYLCAVAWHETGPAEAPIGPRVVRLVEKRMIRFGAGVIICAACAVAILVAQSRGALVATVGGFAIVGALGSGRRHAVRRVVLIVLSAAAIVTIIVAFAGTEQTVERFRAIGEPSSIGGRGRDLVAAFGIWRRFPLFGSGLGTFAGVVSVTGVGDPGIIINHAHDDYVEIIATTGAAGFTAGMVPFLAGVVALALIAFRRNHDSSRLAAFRAAALTSIIISMLHALVDFNFFIPANPATLAAIAGAAVAITDRR